MLIDHLGFCDFMECMITYKALFVYLDDGTVHAEIADFPGVITFGDDLNQARSRLRDALVDMAETLLIEGEPLPTPGHASNDLDADLDEPIHLVLSAARKVQEVPEPIFA